VTKIYETKRLADFKLA